MSEKGLERETEGISVGEREPVVADSSPKGGRLRSSWKKLWKGRKRKALALLLVVAIAGGVGPRTDGLRCDDVSGGGGGAPLYH